MELFADIIETLAFEKDNRIGPVQRAGHQSLGIIGRDREDNFQTRDMRAERCPVLGMLRAVF